MHKKKEFPLISLYISFSFLLKKVLKIYSKLPINIVRQEKSISKKEE